MNTTFLYLLTFGICIRLILATIPGFKYDMDAWYSWALRLNQVGFSNFYSPDFWTNYTPGYLYILYFLGLIKNLLNLDNQIFYFLLKLPGIAAEVTLGILIYKIVREKTSVTTANIAAFLVLFNPALIFNSSIWGQVDGLLTLILVVSIYFLDKRLLIYSSFFLALSFLVKPQTITILPVFFLFFLKNPSIKIMLKSFTIFIVTIYLFALPFFQRSPITGILDLLLKMIGDYPFTSLNAYNIWGTFGFWISDKLTFSHLTYQQIGYILLSIYWVFVANLYLKRKLSIYTLSALAMLGAYFLPTRAHERYLYPAIPFLILTAAFTKSKITFSLIYALSILHIFNLYFVYIYYEVIYIGNKNILYLPILYDFIYTHNKLWALLSTMTFLIICFILLKLSYAKKPV